MVRRTDTRHMNEIAFVIAPYEYGVGPAEGVEPVVDGLSLVNLFTRADGRSAYAGLTSIEGALNRWVPTEEERTIRLLGCGGGDNECNYVHVRIAADAETVVWKDFWGTTGRRSYPKIGPFRFARRDYEAALARPQRATGPIREHQDL
jgi:hypothetical protein